MNIDDITNQIVEKTGISKEQAQSAVSITLGFVKDKLPEGIRPQLDNLLQGKDLDVSAGIDILKNKFF